MTNRILIFDTTLRDGEQCPGAAMSLREKTEIGVLLDKMGVDVIEAGFAASSQKDADSIAAICAATRNAVICSLARCVKSDIDAAAAALKTARAQNRGRIHVFCATSDIHMKHKLGKTKAEVLKIIKDHVSYAKTFTPDVEFSAEDATRSDLPFLIEAVKVAVRAGATTINLPDTTGYAEPAEYQEFIEKVIQGVGAPASVIYAAHCHNDLGLATANSLSAVKAGARQIECTINGLGERAGNAALEEIVMNLKTRADAYRAYTRIATPMIAKVSERVAAASGFVVQKNKAIVGENAFAHASGVHQDGMAKNRMTYEIMNPADVGKTSTLSITCHSGRRAMEEELKKQGINPAQINMKKLADAVKGAQEKIVSGDLLAALARGCAVSKEFVRAKRASNGKA